MRFIYEYPETNGVEGDLLDSGDVVELAAAAEAAGFDGFAFTEHPIPGARWLDSGGHQSLDPFVALGAVAAATSRLRLLTHLAVVPYRNPFLLAKAAATLDKISRGRLTLGVGTGYLKTEFFALGVDFNERNELFDEALDVLPLHWKGEPFSYEGKHFTARDVIARPRPVQDPIPIWIGGNSKLTLRRVAEKAQGWMPLGGPPELSSTTRTAHIATTEALAAKVRELRDLAGERGSQLDVAPSYLDASVAHPDREAERHREAFQQLAEAGVTTLIVAGPVGTPKESLDFIETFAGTYI